MVAPQHCPTHKEASQPKKMTTNHPTTPTAGQNGRLCQVGKASGKKKPPRYKNLADSSTPDSAHIMCYTALLPFISTNHRLICPQHHRDERLMPLAPAKWRSCANSCGFSSQKRCPTISPPRRHRISLKIRPPIWLLGVKSLHLGKY